MNGGSWITTNGVADMSAPDLSLWSQMEGTSSLLCNSAAIAAAAAVEPTASSTSSSGGHGVGSASGLFNTPLDTSGHSAFHPLTQFNFGLPSGPHPDFSNPFEHHLNGGSRPGHLQVQQPSQPPPPTQQASVPFWSNTGGMVEDFGARVKEEYQVSQMKEMKMSPRNAYGNSPSSSGGQQSIMCLVCLAANSNGLHFGAKVCAACAAFFRRSVSDNKKYICKKSQRCTLRISDMTGYRKICRECRLKRCLEIGMMPENVQHKRHRRDPESGMSGMPIHSGSSGSSGDMLSLGLASRIASSSSSGHPGNDNMHHSTAAVYADLFHNQNSVAAAAAAAAFSNQR